MGAQSTESSGVNYDKDAKTNEAPVHAITLSGFFMGETEVTQALWVAVMGANPSANTDDLEQPVEGVSWDMICQTDGFLDKLNKMTGRTFTLPTEAEWEYAARGGSKRKGYSVFSGNTDPFQVAVFKYPTLQDEDDDTNTRTKPEKVKSKVANELGLYDMSGNVYEWCFDKRSVYVAAENPSVNPIYPGANHIVRGGSWDESRTSSRISNRSRELTAANTYNYVGFRLVLRVK